MAKVLNEYVIMRYDDYGKSKTAVSQESSLMTLAKAEARLKQDRSSGIFSTFAAKIIDIIGDDTDDT